MALVYENGVFTNRRSGGGVEEVIDVVWTPVFVNMSTATTVIPAVTNKMIKVLAWACSSGDTSAGSFRFFSDATLISAQYYYPITTDKQKLTYPFIPIGYYKTKVGEALKIDVIGTGSNTNMDLCTITYTP